MKKSEHASSLFGGRAMKARVWAAVVTILLAANLGAAGAAPPSTSQDVSQQLKAAFQAYAAGDCSKVLTISAPVLDHLAGLPDEVVTSSYDMVARCALDVGREDDAYAYLVRGTALKSASDDLWVLRFAVEVHQKKYSAAISTLEGLTRTRKTAVHLLPRDQIGALGRGLRVAKDKPLEARFLQIVSAPDFTPDSPFWQRDYFRFQLAALLKDDGRVEDAHALIRQIDDPDILIMVGLDPRFRAIATKSLDVRAAMERELARDQQLSKAYPALLEGYLQQVQDLRRLGRDNDALALLESARTRTGLVRQFSDQDDSLSWYWNERGYVLASLGNKEDAILSLSRGGVTLEGGELNVSQVINLAQLQVEFGLGRDAIETLEVFRVSKRRISPFGELEMRAMRVCAHSLVGSLSEASEDIAYARAHEQDNAQAASLLLICAGDQDAAAAILIRTLDDPDQRAAALENLSEFEKLGSKRGDFFDRQLARISNRSDVADAIERAGGRGKFNIRSSGF